MITDGFEVKFGKRSSYLGGNAASEFYSFKPLLPEYTKKMLHLFEHVRKHVTSVRVAPIDPAEIGDDDKFDFSKIKTVRVYGELYGGLYPHPDVPKKFGVKHIQKGVYYSPEIRFCAFDLRVGTQFLSYAKACEVFKATKMPYLKPVVLGTLEEVLQFDVEEFESTISETLKLPKLEDNIAEGIVIREFDGLSHAMVKKKANKFSERTGGNPRKSCERDDEKCEVDVLKEELRRYINANRFDNVRSKEAPSTGINSLVGKLVADALKDFRQDFGDRLDALSVTEQKSVCSVAGKFAQSVVKDANMK
eukprot:TRINITY_DN11801_c0_g1_i2.p1 TRINITY_DN11801_c0_g1~~TRINITY_DN11801_c0_g1_i2.p1  ORF type:complete len:306 (-),score=105.64 TRINITY_DN11801_c0_g1_i2:92-1009(-)